MPPLPRGLKNIPVVHAPPDLAWFYLSQIVQQLRQARITLLMVEIQRQNLPLDCRLSYFVENR